MSAGDNYSWEKQIYDSTKDSEKPPIEKENQSVHNKSVSQSKVDQSLLIQNKEPRNINIFQYIFPSPNSSFPDDPWQFAEQSESRQSPQIEIEKRSQFFNLLVLNKSASQSQGDQSLLPQNKGSGNSSFFQDNSRSSNESKLFLIHSENQNKDDQSLLIQNKESGNFSCFQDNPQNLNSLTIDDLMQSVKQPEQGYSFQTESVRNIGNDDFSKIFDIRRDKTVKNGNLPKFFVRQLIEYGENYIHHFNGDMISKNEFKKFIQKEQPRMKKEKNCNYTRKDLMKSLGVVKEKKISKKSLKKCQACRKILNNILRDNLEEIVLENSQIVNKKEYMIASKVFAHRCRNQTLIERLKYK